MALLNVQVVLKTSSGIPEDWITNTWHFDDGELTASWALISTQLQAFYNGIRTEFSSWVVQNGHEIKMYKLSDPEPRAPVYSSTWNFASAPAGAMLPPEVACCLSFQADKVSGTPQARRRGRVYLGPLDTVCIDANGLIAPAAQTSFRNEAQTLLTASQTSVTWKWAVYSKVLGTGANVADGWVDNECDTQRRRSRIATNRQTFT